jgi:hypothetical protein
MSERKCMSRTDDFKVGDLVETSHAGVSAIVDCNANKFLEFKPGQQV